MRFHALGIQHTITSKEYVACAFTQKVLKFCSMMKERGHIIIHYGHEDSDVQCTEHVTVLTRKEYQETYGTHDFKSKFFKFDLNDQAYRTFNENAIREVNARKQPGDFLLAFWGSGHEVICKNAGIGMTVVEPGIGYPYGHFAEYKIFESYALYHSFTGLQRVGNCCDMNTWSKEKIIPNYFEPSDFDFSTEKDDYFLFVGRIGTAKGLEYAIRMTEKLGVQLKVAGQNVEGGFQEVGFWPPPKHVDIIGHIDTVQKKYYMSRAKAVICFSMFTEPFCGVHVEAMMSGTPVLTSDWGAFTEYVVDGVTGFRCRTLDELVDAGRKVHTIDPMKCREWAMSKFSTSVVAKLYEDFFESIRPKHRVAVWLEANWAFGRYARAIKKYMQDVDVYDWANTETNKHLWIDGHWRDYETIISNTSLLRIRDVFGIDIPEEMSRRFLVISFFPKFEGTGYFQETLKNFPKNARYGGASLEICKVMREMGISNVKCIPFTADLEEFRPRHTVQTVKRLGIIGGPSRTNHPEYQENKGIPMFDEICRKGGFEPVYIHGRTGDIYHDVDLLICCSRYEGGPTGLFEAAAMGIPILSRRVGCAQDVKGIALFDTVDEALVQLAYWNENISVLEEYTKNITREVRVNWGMKTLIDRHLKSTVYGLDYVMKKYGSRNYLEGCDKATIHSYSSTYETLFNGLRDLPIRLVEIGVCSGASLKVWEEYFTHPDAEFIGIDISSENIRYTFSERSKVLIQDATREPPTGMFDIIIDDGSHILNDQISALQLLHSQLKPDGLYIIEDVQSIENANEILKTPQPLHFEIKDLRTFKGQYDDIMLIGQHRNILDFIEIGTSDFDTEIQKQDGRTGLSIEPVQTYLNALPTMKSVQKINAAISNYDGKVNIYSVSPDQIDKHNFPDWVRGCNSIGTYHPRVIELIQLKHLDEREIINVERVDVMTFGTLCRRYHIKGCRYLKIDTEGHDHVILHSYMDSIEHEGIEKALRIHFESNELTDSRIVNGVLERLNKFGYRVVERGYNTTVELIS
jgi:glycosyltransferase involved in cell wall biosynthesis/SAM-dependent methyltransferase